MNEWYYKTLKSNPLNNSSHDKRHSSRTMRTEHKRSAAALVVWTGPFLTESVVTGTRVGPDRVSIALQEAWNLAADGVWARGVQHLETAHEDTLELGCVWVAGVVGVAEFLDDAVWFVDHAELAGDGVHGDLLGGVEVGGLAGGLGKGGKTGNGDTLDVGQEGVVVGALVADETVTLNNAVDQHVLVDPGPLVERLLRVVILLGLDAVGQQGGGFDVQHSCDCAASHAVLLAWVGVGDTTTWLVNGVIVCDRGEGLLRGLEVLGLAGHIVGLDQSDDPPELVVEEVIVGKRAAAVAVLAGKSVGKDTIWSVGDALDEG